MILPFGTNRPLQRPTKVTYALVAINVLALLVQMIWGSPRVDPAGWQRIHSALWLDPNAMKPWALVTYQFMHAGIWHLVGNMLFLLVFGPNVEDRFGRYRFLVFYLTGGAIAGMAHALLEHAVVVAPGVAIIPPVVGASGSIAAVTGAYLVLFPKTTIRIFVVFFIIGAFQIPAAWLIGFAIAKDVLFQGLGASHGVAVIAHIGGYIFGIGLSLGLLATNLLPREPYDLFSLGRQAHRRRMFKELTSGGQAPWSADLGEQSPVRRSKSEPDPVQSEATTRRRAEVSTKLAEGDIDEAARLYIALVEDVGELSMSRDAQYDLANHFYATRQFDHAAVAYDIFLKRHPRDHETARVKLILAVINARYLNDPIRAKELLATLGNVRLHDSERELADTLAKELG